MISELNKSWREIDQGEDQKAGDILEHFLGSLIDTLSLFLSFRFWRYRREIDTGIFLNHFYLNRIIVTNLRIIVLNRALLLGRVLVRLRLTA